ncbi:MAG TPA: hypothetical protein VEQ63_16225 [Bryobacteraceae bacterium]|nr:hypothetical protein [Bryobacteraceae bacterium]
MRVKSYYASSVEAAISSAALEMGPDAVLITSKRTGPEHRDLGEYEVVFGSHEEPPIVAEPAASGNGSIQQALVSSELELVRKEVQSMRKALSIAWRNSSNGHWLPEVACADSMLTEADFAPELKGEILSLLEARLREEAMYNQAARSGPGGAFGNTRTPTLEALTDRVSGLLVEQLRELIQVQPTLGARNTKRSIIAMVGPTGAGKTTTIAKLAIRYGLASRRPALIVSTDSYRVGATEQLRMYSAAMGIAFQMVDEPAHLTRVLEEHANKELIFIDTPGFGPADMDVAAELAEALSYVPDLDVHLALPATMRSKTIGKVVDRFHPFRPRKAVITKLDETESLGGALSHAILSGLPVSFITDGQQIPDDLQPASVESLLRAIIDLSTLSTAAAA